MKSAPEIRPILKLKLTKTDYLLEAAVFIGLAAICILAITTYQSLPEIIPTHYGIKGQADDWGNKATIFILPVISLVLIIGISILNGFPHIFNHPVKVTEENALQLYRKGTQLIRIIKVFIVILFLFIEWQISNVPENNQLPIWFLPVVLIIPVILPVIMAFTMTGKTLSGKRR
jgi:uncharacterized membrane protein